MLNFEMKPSQKLELEFIKNDGRRTRRKDLHYIRNNMPHFPGVYVIYMEEEIARFHGTSPILKIGASDNLHERFKQYNNKKWVTKPHPQGRDFSVAEVMGIQREGRTDAFVMSQLWNLKSQKIFLDFYNCDGNDLSPVQLEEIFLNKYLEQHWEIPPLNLSLKG